MTDDDAWRDEIEDAAHRPGPLVFLCGPQRSGTTLLHRLLTAGGAVRYVSAFDVWSYGTLISDRRGGRTEAQRDVLAQLLAGFPPDRGLDATPVGPQEPEEYGLVLTSDRLRLADPDLTEASMPAFCALLGKKALLDGTDRLLLLKNPPDYPALARLLERFPEARFLVLHRHPLAVLRSELRAWRLGLRRRNPYVALLDRGYAALMDDPRERIRLELALHAPAGAGWLADRLLAGHSRWLDIAAPPGRLLDLRYEDLLATPRATLARVAEFLALDLPSTDTLPPGGRASLPLDLAETAFAERCAAFAPYLDRLGYTEAVTA